MKKLGVILLVVVVLSMTTGVQAQDNLLAYGESVNGILDNNTAAYTFDGTEGDVVTISLESDEFDAYLVLADTEGTELTSDDDGGADVNARIAGFPLPATGTYTITVQGWGGADSGAYTLSLDLVTLETITIDSSTPGNLTGGTYSFYSFSAVAGDMVDITLDSDSFDPYLALNGPDGEELVANDDGGDGFNARITAFTLPVDGTYTIVVSDYWEEDGGSYVLGLNTTVPIPPVIDAPIAIGETATGTLQANVHTYVLTASADEVVTISLESDQFDTYLSVLDSSGSELVYDDDSGDDFNAMIVAFFVPADGTYTIEVSGYDEMSFGDYTLAVQPTAFSGEPIRISSTRTGTLTDTVHLHMFAGTTGGRVTINLTSLEFDAYLQLLGPDGSEVAYDDDSGGDLNAQITDFVLPANGNYVIVVQGIGGPDTGSYDLTVTLPE
ncbi:MAG: hypothetical protein GYB65_00830 [Chloroflexi bacterium]|nr:hypothetical protein [Chloroflexota bacterium]